MAGRKSIERKNRRRRRRRRKIKALICAVLEILIVLTVVLIAGWKFGIGSWLSQLGSPAVKSLDLSGITSTHAILIQAKSGKTVGQIDADEVVYPASLTKIMTAIVAIEHLKDLNQEITLDPDIFPNLYASDATRAGFEPGETVRAIDLLYGVILPSGAECCIGLADAISGSEEKFVDLMNQKAEKLGMKHTHFCDTTGLHDPDHYSSCRDMAVLLKYAISNDTFREIIESHWHSTPGTNIHPDGITYYSSMFKSLSDSSVTGGEILGGKTGFTNDAGLCLASFAEIEGREYILVTTGANVNGAHIQDAVTIYNRIGEAAKAISLLDISRKIWV